MSKQKKEQAKIIDLSPEKLDALVTRLEEAIEFNLALSADDIRLLLNAVMTLATMQERLSDNKVTLHKLRKLLGIVKSSEKLSGLLGDGKKNNPRKTTNPKKPKKNKTPPPPKVFHPLMTVKKGDVCPECLVGKLYKYEPAQLLRITGQTPFTPELHISERLRCNACGQFFTAPLSDEVLNDGSSNQKYGFSARSLMVINKYFMGSPFYRQESLQSILGLSICASTIFDQSEYVANDVQPVFNYLKVIAANATHFHLDDTTHLVLDQKAIEKKIRGSDKMQTRTGLYASGIIATTDNQDIILFQTNIGHAGEFIDELLANRHRDKSPPILMSDALSSNNPTVRETYQGACNSHARRQFVDVINQFPDLVPWVLENYKQIWIHEDECMDKKMSSPQRLAYHKKHSLPVMEKIQSWAKKQFDNETVEENSTLGKAISYFNRHFERLTLFCTIEGAKIDNNYMEAILKLIVRNRKNAYFYKTPAGAAISDVITSCIATAMQADVNVFDYFNAIQRNSAAVKNDPSAWLPWNYTKNN
jgi:hypothetical protein